MCDNNSNAKDGEISSTVYSPTIISFRKAAFSPAALVVPGSVL